MNKNTTYWAYAYNKARPTAPLQLEHATYDDARATANRWSHQGHAVVHVTEMTYVTTIADSITERLVWTAAGPELDWR